MKQIEKTVFISYRHTNAPWALAIFKNLTSQGYDVFYDFHDIASGDFEHAILENIKARAHFLVLLTPSALERCDDPKDWFRHEIETALDTQRNIVPLMLEGFDFATPAIASKLTRKLAALKRYNALNIPVDYFDAAMERLRTKFLNVPLDAVLHPTSVISRQTAKAEQAAASAAPPVQQQELTAQKWFEEGVKAVDLDQKIRFYSQAIRLKPDDFKTYTNRGASRSQKGDYEGALRDYDKAIRLKPDECIPYFFRGIARSQKGDLKGALRDYDEAIRLNSYYAEAYLRRGDARSDEGDLEGALRDYDEAIRLKPFDANEAYNKRGILRRKKGDIVGAIFDYGAAKNSGFQGIKKLIEKRKINKW